MSAEKTTLEVIAPTVEEAIQKGLNELNLSEEAVDVEVLDPGTRGLFGLGSRQARVRLTVRSEPEKVMESSLRQTSALFEEEQVALDARDGIPQEDILSTARQTVMELLEKMKIKAQVTATIKPAEEKDDEDTVLVNIEGDDLSILIGRRAETLSALQYITSLIVGKRLNRWIPLMIDVQGYRARRERQLRVLARRMAEQAIHTGRRQVLEPMPANERRVIHLELRDHPQVATESIGEDPNRKVTIFLKK
ncbi:MAG TPA: protein jag [Anaerolinea thermolimosa]|uniref:RNA-binding protein KhpB n=1 Tax=Anaerolinea thermolimosa TaxID=229919 RepID=A0A3D1JHX3_9CHLR|nr:RNA-binding cell elongation regulator Jag/EloR [Anaerolinea thermolimosa]GAP07074.1 predicted RNA-binding protein [Anaerolinea thermolimosa]HCE18083.1 protein jag [Anaerolinea thermolimosa]